ncbi:MAG: hypothetical protein M1813_003508 [Trichoglossum hirsutum]|nr:MAG: hypothetical protein M1813_003508 [Trichoglossum hirsutum]
MSTHEHRNRLRQFFLPDGRKVHIAASPQEADTLKHKLSRQYPDQEFDLYIHGSPEHVGALREAHSHHEQRRRSLREKQPEVFDEFENVRLELDALSTELHMLTEHGVQLDANFSKYGYSAYLRTHDSPDQSSATSLNGDHSTPHEKRDWEAERRKGTTIRLWRRPVVRQYFHRGLLWRASTPEEVASFELFLDLLYVGIIAINGDKASEDPTGLGLLRFCVTFIPGWKLWTDISIMTSWFDSDDVVQRVSVLFHMACLLAYTTNIVGSFDHTYAQLISFYLASRLFGAVYFLWMGYLLPMVRSMMIHNALCIVAPSALWIASIHVEEPRRLALVWVAIVLDLFGSTVGMFLIRYANRISEKFAARMEKVFEFYPAVNIEHKSKYGLGNLKN